MKIVAISLLVASLPIAAEGCGLDWSLPVAHYEGVEEHGYVAYWEKIGDIDLGSGLVIPVHIGFNSRREASSAVLGKGWIVALLESHVEPVDDNCMRVIMPDGWTFLQLSSATATRRPGAATWAGSARRTTRFSPSQRRAGGRSSSTGAKSSNSKASSAPLTWRYNGGVPTEVDDGDRAILQVEPDPATGAGALVIDGHRIGVAMGKRPEVTSQSGGNLIAGFDPCVSGLQRPDGKKETFDFSTDGALFPTLTIAGTGAESREFSWDPATRQIRSDGDWTYQLVRAGDHLHYERTAADGKSESYEADNARGVTVEKGPDGREVSTYRFPAGPLAGQIRKIVEDASGEAKVLYTASYYPSGNVMRETFWPDMEKEFSDQRQLLKETIAGEVIYEQDFDAQGRLVHLFNPAQSIEMKRTYNPDGGQTTQVFRDGALFYSEQIDRNNRLVSLDEGEK